VFLRCVDRLDDLENPASYLRVSVVNACRREFRRRARLTNVMADVVETGPTSESVDLCRALLELGPRKRAAVVLRFYEDMSFDEVAGALGCAPATARSLVRRAMNEMRGAIDER
jgi:RNA polymerase sigma factor (sigma-70 family)